MKRIIQADVETANLILMKRIGIAGIVDRKKEKESLSPLGMEHIVYMALR